jgi:hypothetical protein
MWRRSEKAAPSPLMRGLCLSRSRIMQDARETRRVESKENKRRKGGKRRKTCVHDKRERPREQESVCVGAPTRPRSRMGSMHDCSIRACAR